MNKIIISLIVIIFSINAFSQDLSKKKTIIAIDTLIDNTFSIVQFDLDSVPIFSGKYSSRNPEIKQGKFYFFYPNGKLKYTANFHENYPVGKWYFLDLDGKPIKTLDYDYVWDFLNRVESNEVKFDCYSQFDNELTLQDMHLLEGEIYFVTEEKPKFQNMGIDNFRDYILENINSEIFLNGAKSSKVRFEFIVNKCGKIGKVNIIYGDNLGMNTELIRTIINAPDWQAGKQRNQYVDILINMETEIK